MSRPLRDESVALRKLKTMIAAESYPTLSSDEVMDLLQDHRIAKVWAPNMVVQIGDVVVPPIPTGLTYVVSPVRDQDGNIGGTTGATEPRWNLPWTPEWFETSFIEDGTVRWVLGEEESEWGLWDLRAAAHAGWNLKADMTAGEYAVTTESGTSHPEQVHAQCVARANQYRPVRIYSA